MTGEFLEAAWRWSRAPVPGGVVGVWAAFGVVVAVFIVRFRTDWREGVKAGVALVAAGAVLGCLVVWRSAQDLPDVVRDRNLQVYGHVACGSIERRSGTDDYRFQIRGSRSQADVVLEVRYMELVPRGFREGKLVVVRGMLAADGVLDVVEDGIAVNSCAYDPPLQFPRRAAVLRAR